MKNPSTGSKYKFAIEKQNYEDYSSGRVLYGAPGATGFPVRLICEIFQRAAARLEDEGVKAPYSIYDPFCGIGYSLTVIGLLHGATVKNIIASDISKDAVVTANKNLSLLTQNGFNTRVKELNHLKNIYNKPSHKEALESAKILKTKIRNVVIKCFEFNILGDQQFPIPNASIDLVLSDLPYGKLTQWEGKGAEGAYVHDFLARIYPLLKPKAVVAISADKKQKIAHESYKRFELIRIGKRQVFFLDKLI